MKIASLLFCVNSVWTWNQYIKKIDLVQNRDVEDVENIDGSYIDNGLDKKITIESKKCNPDTFIIKDCNVCKCNSRGSEERCTMNDCVAQKQRGLKTIKRRIYEDISATGSCKPNTWYALQPCQFCYCHNSSMLVCSTRASVSGPITLGSHNLTDCGMGLVRELYDLGISSTPDSIPRTNAEGETTSYTADAPGNTQDISSAQAVPYSPSPAQDEHAPITHVDSFQGTWADHLPHKQADYLPHPQANYLPHPQADYLPHPQADYLPHPQQDNTLSWKLDLPIDVPESTMPWTMEQRSMDTFIPTGITPPRDSFNGPEQSSMQMQKQYTPLIYQYKPEYENKKDSTISPYKKAEALMHLNVAKNEIMDSHEMPRAMTEMLASLHKESQAPFWEQESKKLDDQMGETEIPLFSKYAPLSPQEQELQQQMNLPPTLQHIIQLALRKSMVRIDSSQTCTPGETTKDGCNYCFCLNNGKKLCTDNKTC
ncbi:hypothetical protein O0L34_g10055 [Tuta absoluta]|nr:hypothetical protein O0L34_g10055 [Tuta absoluta]